MYKVLVVLMLAVCFGCGSPAVEEKVANTQDLFERVCESVDRLYDQLSPDKQTHLVRELSVFAGIEDDDLYILLGFLREQHEIMKGTPEGLQLEKDFWVWTIYEWTTLAGGERMKILLEAGEDLDAALAR